MEKLQASLPTTLFRVGHKKQQWFFDGNAIISETCEIPLSNVISIKYVHKKSVANPPNPKKFKLFYAKSKKKNIWRLYNLTFQSSDTNVIILWVNTLNHLLDNLKTRPRQLLLFINPYGGKKNGLQVYETYAKPLFKLADVDVHVIISQRRNQIRDIVIYHSFEKVDAVACIGGDGTSNEMFNGLVLRECRLHDINPDDVSVKLPKPQLPVGLIPGGSTDTTVYGVHGTTDVVTSILHIIMGISLGLDLATVHNDNRLLRVYSNVTSYGFLGDTAYHSEKLRWMGPSRYEYAGFRRLIRNQGYKGSLRILCNDIQEYDEKCYMDCKRCKSINEDKHKWVSITGKFFLIAGTNMSCAGERNPAGLAPYCHLGDGHFNVLVVHHTTLYKNLKTLQRFTQSTYSINDLPHVDVYRGKEFHFRADGVPGRWNCDGEVLHQTDIHAKVHRQLINVYGRGISPPSK